MKGKSWSASIASVAVFVGLSCLRCSSFSAATPDPDPDPDVDVPAPQTCPTSWTNGATTVPFNEPPPNAPTIASAPFSVFVQGTDGARGVPNVKYANMISKRFPKGQLVMLGKADDLAPGGPYLAALASLSPDVELALTLDVTHKPYQTVQGQLDGLDAFQTLVTTATNGTRSISALVYQTDGGKLDMTELADLSHRMPTGVSLTLFGGIGRATPARPAGWNGPYTSMVETYGLFSHSCERKVPELDILVDGPADGGSICGDTCDCTPAGTASVYEVCSSDPAQAGRIIGYLASLKAVPADNSLDGVVFVFSFDPAPDDPTISPASWGPTEYATFAEAFAQMLASERKLASGTISMGTWDMTGQYSSDNGWDSTQ